MDLYAFDACGAAKVILTDTPECGTGMRYELINLDTGNVERASRSLCRTEEVPLENPNARYAIGITWADLKTGSYKFTLQAR